MGDKQLHKSGQVVDHRDDLLSQRAASKTRLPHKTEKQTANCNLPWTVEGLGGTLSLPQREGAGQRAKLPALSSQYTNTVISHLPKQSR
jgi:hypothetical protein